MRRIRLGRMPEKEKSRFVIGFFATGIIESGANLSEPEPLQD